MALPLDGIKVLDLSRFIAGPHCAMLLGDMGADVIKIEKKGTGDDSRHLPPFINGESIYAMALNRNKRSLTLDFREPSAQAILKELASNADVLLENFRPGTMEKMGCGWDELHAINPRLIMTRLSGFGQSGPYSQRPGFDGIAQAMSGLMGLTGDPEGSPFLAGTFYIDYMSGMYGATATLGALHARNTTGVGQMIDVSLLDSAVSMLTTAVTTKVNKGVSLNRMGNRDRYSSPANVFKTAEGDFILLLSGTDPLFRRITALMGRPDLVDDERFQSVDKRVTNTEAIEEIVQGWIGQLSTEEALSKIQDAGIPCAKVATIDDVVNDPQLAYREQILESDHPVAGKITTPGLTMKLSGTPLQIRRPAPVLGQHSGEVLEEWLGKSQAEVAALAERGVI